MPKLASQETTSESKKRSMETAQTPARKQSNRKVPPKSTTNFQNYKSKPSATPSQVSNLKQEEMISKMA